MSWLRRKPVRVATGVLVFILLAVVAVKLFLPAEKIRDLALAQAEQRLGRAVTVGDASVSLRGGLGVRLADLVVANPPGFAGDALLTTASVDLKLALGPLLHREIRVDRLVIDGPIVHLTRQADGSDNFTFASDAAAAGPATSGTGAAGEGAPPLSVAQFTVQDGKLVYSDAGIAAPGVQSVSLSGLALELSLADPSPGRYTVSGHLAAEEIGITGPKAVPALSGEGEFTAAWNAATSRLDLQQVALRVLGVPLTATGQLVVQGGSPTGSVQLNVADLAVGDLAAFLPAAVAAKLDDTSGGGHLDATVALQFTGSAADPVMLDGTAAAHDIDLTLAQPFLPPGQPGKLSGWAGAEAHFAGPADEPMALDVTGAASLSDVSYLGSGLVDDLQDLQAVLKFDREAISVESCRARFGAGTFDLTGRLRDPLPYFLPPQMQTGRAVKIPHLDFELRTARLDVDRWLPAASPTGGTESGTTDTRSAGATSGPAAPQFPDLTSDGTFQADSLIYMAVPLTDVAGAVTLRDRRLRVHDVAGAVYRGKVLGDVAIDLNDLQAPVYSGNYQATGIEVDDFAARFAGLSGVVFGSCDLAGSFSARGLDPQTIRDGLSVDADAGLAQGRFVTTGTTYEALSKVAGRTGGALDREQALRDLATHISVADGRVHLNALTTRLGQVGDLSVDGYYGFNGDLDYSGSLLLTKAETDRLFSGGALAELGKLMGARRPARLELPLSVGGTRAAPRVRLDLGAVTRRMQEKVAQEQGDKLGDEAKRKLGDLLKKWK